MAVSTKNLDQRDRRWIWKLVLRVIAIVVALVAVSCVAWVTDYLRQWIYEHPGDVDRRYQSDMFILPWLLFTVCRFPFFLPYNEPVFLVSWPQSLSIQSYIPSYYPSNLPPPAPNSCVL